ncbi:MAG: hypothetical protein ACM3XN_02485 [Chloroflexota bacterium]
MQNVMSMYRELDHSREQVVSVLNALYRAGSLNSDSQVCKSIKSWLAYLAGADFDVVHDIEQIGELGESMLLDLKSAEPHHRASGSLLESIDLPELLLIVGGYRYALKGEISKMASDEGLVSDKVACLSSIAKSADEKVEEMLSGILRGAQLPSGRD